MYQTLDQQNEAALDTFIYMPVDIQMVRYLAQKAGEVINCEPQPTVDAQLPATPPTTPPPTQYADIPSLERFIAQIIRKSNVQVPTLMATLVYLARLKSKLPPAAKGLRCTMHRIFLASLILSAKNLNDSSPKNKHWAEYTFSGSYPTFGFNVTEVNLMEKQLLFLLDWDLNITTQDLYTHLEPFLAPIRCSQAAELMREEAERLQEARLHEEVRLREHRALEQRHRELSELREYQRRARHYSPYSPGKERRSRPVHAVAPTCTPPTECPGLSHSGTEDNLSSYTPSRSVTPSSRFGTPASSISSLSSYSSPSHKSAASLSSLPSVGDYDFEFEVDHHIVHLGPDSEARMLASDSDAGSAKKRSRHAASSIFSLSRYLGH